MAIARYYRSLVQARTLAPPWSMPDYEAKRYRCWQRMMRRMDALDRQVIKLRELITKRYHNELKEVYDREHAPEFYEARRNARDGL